MTDLSMVDLIYVLETLQKCSTRVKRTSRTRGGNYNGLCPLCGDRNGLYVLPEALNEQGQIEGKWACRTCHQKESDAIGMLVHYDKLTYAQAFTRLRELYPDLPNSSNYKNGTKGTSTPPQIRIKPLAENAVPPSQEWQARARKVLAASQEWLWGDQGKEARQYLFNRKLTEETIKAAGLGFLWLENGQSVIREKPSNWGLDPDQYEEGIYLPSGIVIPYFYKGELWKLRIRRLGDDIPKNERYSMVSGGSNGLYNADDVRLGQPVLNFEGEIDALSVKQALSASIACVATGGTTQARIPLWLSKLALASRVLICFDNDKKSETTAKAIQYWKDRLVHSKVYPVPTEYKDANAMLCANGDIKSWVVSGLDNKNAPAQPIVTSTVQSQAPDHIEDVIPEQEPTPLQGEVGTPGATIHTPYGQPNPAIKTRTCCQCDLPAEHFSPSGYGYCTGHYLCAGGHAPRWMQYKGDWMCACVADRMPIQVVQSHLVGVGGAK